MTRNDLDVLVWTENYWIGGCDRFLIDLTHGLRDRPVRISLAGNEHPAFDRWLSDRAPELLPRHVLPVANLVTSPLQRLRRRTPPTHPSDGAMSAAAAPAVTRGAVAALRYEQAARNFRSLRRFFRARRPDVLHINNGGYPGAESGRIAVLAAHAEGISRIVHFVHNMAYPPASPQWLERRLDARIDRATDAWVTAAHRASGALSSARGLDPRRVHTLHYGIPAAHPIVAERIAAVRDELGFGADALNVVVVAGFEPRKGHRVLVEALAGMRTRDVNIRTAFVGAGAELAGVQEQVSHEGLAGQVRFTGWRDDVDAILASADALVLPSLGNECLPYAILEAMDRGLPVVATDVAGIPEMVQDGITGRVVPPGNAQELAEALAAFAGDATVRRTMGERGRVRVRAEFDVPQMVDGMVAFWAPDELTSAQEPARATRTA